MGEKLFPFLLDTGAQLSVINYELLGGICHSTLPCDRVRRPLSGFLGLKGDVDGYMVDTKITLPSSEVVDCNFFAINRFNIDLHVRGISKFMENAASHNIPVSPNAPKYKNDSVKLFGIIGNDLIEKFKVFEKQNINNCNLLRLSNGFVPMGTVTDLKAEMVPPVHTDNNNNGELKVDNSNRFSILQNDSREPYEVLDKDGGSLCDSPRHSSESKSHPQLGKQIKRKTKSSKSKSASHKFASSISFVLEPKSSYFSPLEHIFPESQVEHGLEHLSSMESIGINENSSFYDDREIEQFEKSIELKDNKYFIEIPWRRDVLARVQSNFKLAKAIACKVSSKNGSLDDKYFDVFQEQLNLGIIEKLPEPKNPNKHVWIPHRPIVRNDPLVKNTKIRPVFNASLKVGNSPSLNEAAYPGKNLLNELLSLIQYFRTNNFVLLADIAKAFLNIYLKKESDKNCFSFVVYHNNKFHYFRYRTIIFGFITSPFILNFIIHFHAKKCSNPSVKNILNNKFYVDNMIYTSNDRSELISVGKNVADSLSGVSLKLREWASNDVEIVKEFDPSCEELIDSKLLGYLFHASSDSMSVKNFQLNESCTTKRQIISTISSVFDPIGLLSPLMVEGKLFLRKLCINKYAWDSKLSNDLILEWEKYSRRINSSICSDISVPRKIASDNEPVKFVVFCDASKLCYGFVVYCIQGNKSSLFFSKFKLAPMASKTLPSLELLAVYLAMQCLLNIMSNVNFNLKVSGITFLTDSQVALAWLLSGKVVKKNIFVTNRIKDITTFKDGFSKLNVDFSFSYVPTASNMADILTRVVSVSKFSSNLNSWFSGPSWLTVPQSQWPSGQLGCIPSPFKDSACNIENESSPLLMPIVENCPLIDMKKYSSYSKLLGVTIKVFKACKRFKSEPVVLSDLKKQAFTYLIKSMQSECFPSEIEFLKNCSSYKDVPKNVQSLNMFIDKSGILRSKGRMSKNLILSYDAVNPIIACPSHHLTELIIINSHFECKHLGVESTVNHLRQTGFWVVNVRVACRNVLKNCIVCHKYNSKSFKLPPTPDLPHERVNFLKPFNHTGIDYTGHFFVKDFSGNKHKVYILIFSCMNSRAIHLEVVDTMSTHDFILAFVRFYNRYGLPQVIYSDNAKSFLSSTTLLSNLIASDHFQQTFIKYNVKHKTIPAYSPWFGASYERLIKTVKQCLYKTFGRNIVKDTSFLTSLSDIQLSINNRPLTYRDCDNHLEVVTPNHLISTGNSFPSLIICEEFIDSDLEEETIRNSLLNSLELRDVVINKFRKEWYTNYLLSLRDKHKNSFTIKECHENPEFLYVGSVVLIKNPVRPRPYWSIGRIVELLPGEDGIIRVVKVRRADRSITCTSISNLYPLELSCSLENEDLQIENLTEGEISSVDVSPETSVDAVAEENSSIGRPVRKAALNFKNKLRNWLENDQV